MGKKIIDFVMRCDASRGKKIKGRGGGLKSKAAKLYTPLKSGQTPSNDSHNLFVNPKRTWRAKQKAKI